METDAKNVVRKEKNKLNESFYPRFFNKIAVVCNSLELQNASLQ
jgi:hypothetical protein